MEDFKSKLSPREVTDNKKLFSMKIHYRVVKVSEEILKSLDKLNIENDEGKKVFLHAVNHYYRDLCMVIFHLRQVTNKIDGDDQGVCDLLNVITELNKIMLLTQESLNFEIEKLKIQLKSTIVDVGSQVEKLMKIIEYDNLHEHKQKVLDCQHDLVISAEAFKLYSQFSDLSLPELEELIHEAIEKITNNLIQIKSGHQLLAEDFSHYTRHSVQILENSLNYMRKMINTENFPIEVVNAFRNADLLAIKYVSELLEAAFDDNPMNKMLDCIENGHPYFAKGSAEIQKLLQTVKENNIGKKSDEGIKQLIIHMYIHAINGMSALNQSIEDAISKI